MLKWIELEGVGPAPHLRIDLAPRINVLTGDNGLGKTFLLDVAWWALSQSWAGRPGWPRPDAEKQQIRCAFSDPKVTTEFSSSFNPSAESWSPLEPDRLMDGLVLYARVDGGFSLLDSFHPPLRPSGPLQLLKQGSIRYPKQRFDLHFEQQEVWEGLVIEGRRRCEGLIRDWVSWQRGRMPEFEQLKSVLRTLSTEDEPLEPSEPQRVSLDDGFDTPCIATRYGVVPLTHASAGVRRIVALSYLLVWAWREHGIAAKLLKKQPERRMLLLIDEPETHLHPKWQRRIVPALLTAVKQLLASEDVATQILTATHSPLVLASLEPHFDPAIDKLLHLGLRDGAAYVEDIAWAKQGDVVNWLVSESFGLQQGRSLQAEEAIEAAEAFLRGSPASTELDTRDKIHQRLVEVLAGHDEFWPRWLVESGVIK